MILKPNFKCKYESNQLITRTFEVTRNWIRRSQGGLFWRIRWFCSKNFSPGYIISTLLIKRTVYVVTRLSRAVVTYNLKSGGACHILLATASSAAHVTTVVKTSKSRFAWGCTRDHMSSIFVHVLVLLVFYKILLAAAPVLGNIMSTNSSKSM